jgi:hypothetical protein
LRLSCRFHAADDDTPLMITADDERAVIALPLRQRHDAAAAIIITCAIDD